MADATFDNLTLNQNADVGGKLHVVGAAELQSNTQIHANLTVSRDSSGVGGNLTIAGTALLGGLTVQGQAQMAEVDVSGDLRLSGAADVVGAAHVYGDLTVEPNSSGMGGNLTITGAATVGSDLAVNGSVEIQGKGLRITGAEEGIRIEGKASDVTSMAYLSFYNHAEQRIGYVGDGSVLDNDVFLAADTGNVGLVTAAGRSLVVSSSGNVGIGTQSPAAKLTVQTPEPYGGNTFRFEAKQQPDAYYLNLNTVVTNGVVRWVFDQMNADTPYSNVLAFDRGHVGIGTADPQGMLDVNGWIVTRHEANDAVAKTMLDTLPNDSLILGGVLTDPYQVQGIIRFYFKDGNGHKWSIEVRGGHALL